MVRLVALYRRPPDTAAFDKHYYSTHKPLVEKVPGLAEFRCSKVFGSPVGRSPWYFMAEMCFKDRESFKTGMMSPEAAATARDLDVFAKGLSEVLFVDESQPPA